MKYQVAAFVFALAACSPTAPADVETRERAAPSVKTPEQLPPTEWRITSIDWDDADSGDINGARFRLSGVDAPETGGVGAAVGAAQCDRERRRGIAARDWIRERTRDPSALRITGAHGYDRMEEPRLLIDLAVAGADEGRAGIEAGHLAPWPHEGSRSLAPKPDWCSSG